MAAHHMNKIAPVHMHSPSSAPSSSSSSSMQQFTVGKLDAGMAILLGSRASLIEFPSQLLPQDVTAGSVVEISVKRNLQQERQNQSDFDNLQRDILDTFGRVGPIAPELKLRALTQTSVVLEWTRLELATANLLSLDIYRNGVRLAPIPNAMHNTSTKLSGLEVGGEYAFHLVLKTTAGVLTSNTIRTRTHTMTDTSGISVCFGSVDGGGVHQEEGQEDAEPISQLEAMTRQLLTQMGAKWSHKLQIDTTHYVCTSPRQRTAAGASRPVNGGGEGAIYRKAFSLNIPVVRPEWIVACHEAKKMVPISAYYIDKDPPNHASVQKLMNRGTGADERGSNDSKPSVPPPVDTNDDPSSSSRGLRERSETPPPPAPKDVPPPLSNTDPVVETAIPAGVVSSEVGFSETERQQAAAAEESSVVMNDPPPPLSSSSSSAEAEADPQAEVGETMSGANDTMEEIDLFNTPSGQQDRTGGTELEGKEDDRSVKTEAEDHDDAGEEVDLS